jgi:hypothetical protein
MSRNIYEKKCIAENCSYGPSVSFTTMLYLQCATSGAISDPTFSEFFPFPKRFLQGANFDDKKHVEPVQSRSDGSTPQMKHLILYELLSQPCRPYQELFNPDTANNMHFIDFY